MSKKGQPAVPAFNLKARAGNLNPPISILGDRAAKGMKRKETVAANAATQLEKKQQKVLRGADNNEGDCDSDDEGTEQETPDSQPNVFSYTQQDGPYNEKEGTGIDENKTATPIVFSSDDDDVTDSEKDNDEEALRLKGKKRRMEVGALCLLFELW